MLNTHIAQQFSTSLTARGGEDLGSCGTGYPYRRLSDAAGRGVDQHFVSRRDPRQVVQAVPGGGVGGRHRGRLVIRQPGGRRDDKLGVAGDEGAPASVGGQAGDAVTDPMISDVGSDSGHHAGEICTELGPLPVEARVSAERDENIGEVDTGCSDHDFDLSGPRRNPFERNEFHRLHVTGCADLHAHSVVPVVYDGGSSLLGAKRTRAQPRHIPLAVSPCGFVLFRPAEQLLCQTPDLCVGVHVDLGRAQVWVFGADHAHQTTQPTLLQIGDVVGQHRLRAPGDDIKAGRLARGFGKLADDAPA